MNARVPGKSEITNGYKKRRDEDETIYQKDEKKNVIILLLTIKANFESCLTEPQTE